MPYAKPHAKISFGVYKWNTMHAFDEGLPKSARHYPYLYD